MSVNIAISAGQINKLLSYQCPLFFLQCPLFFLWNWQHSNWPNFVWDQGLLNQAEQRFAEGAGFNVGVSKHLIADDQLTLAIELLSHDAVDTSTIEGEKLDHASVQASIQRNLGLTPSVQHARPLEAGIANMMTHLYQTLQEPLSEQLLFEWHTHLFQGTVSLDTLGGYRRFSEPMQIVSGPDYKRKIHFEAPPSSHVPAEMTKLLEWYERTGPDAQASLPPITRASVLHLWFESIHPFEDGNGRIGRALAEKALAQSLKTPTLTALAITIARRRKEYFEQLQRANQTLEINDWLLWFASVAIEAQKRTQLWVVRISEQAEHLFRSNLNTHFGSI